MSVWTETRRWAVTGGVVAFVASPRVRTQSHRLYGLGQRIDRAHRSPIGLWVLFGHAEVNAVLRNPLMGSDERKADASLIRLGPLGRVSRMNGLSNGAQPETSEGRGAFREGFHNLMLFRDPPDHTRLRGLVNKAFTPRAIERLEARITDLVERRLDELAPRRSMEFLADFAYPIPAMAICELLGAPVEDHEIVSRCAPAIARRLDPAPMRTDAVEAAGDEAAETLTVWLEGLIAARRAKPGDDILSGLLATEEAGDRLDHQELVATTLLLLIAGHETTANLLGNGLLALLRHPAQWERLRHDKGIERLAVEELMRYDGPIQMAERIALDDVDVGGLHIDKGRIVIPCLAAANRDPAVFAHPDELDIGREPNPHLGFGGGAHFCLGAPLARLEARIALRHIADRLPDVRVATPAPRWRPSFTIRGLEALPLSW